VPFDQGSFLKTFVITNELQIDSNLIKSELKANYGSIKNELE
jgi:hypothetical protein